LQVGDPQEANAIADVFCKDRNTPLLVGSVKSNMGHSEPASGLCSVAKVLIAMESGVIPPNLHYQDPNPDIPALSDGRLQVSCVKHNKVEILSLQICLSVYFTYCLLWQQKLSKFSTSNTRTNYWTLLRQFSSCSYIIP